MLDTNICSFIIRNRPKEVKEKLKEVEGLHQVALSSIVASELLYGAYKKGSRRLLEVVERFIDCFVVYDFDLNAAREFGLIRSELEGEGIVIGAYDLQIAAHARALSAVLVTNNEREFLRVKGLRVENWLKGQEG
ncbi:type II toxin-antitoxin system VapC family toxin [Thermovibrio sp.]